MSQNSSTFDYLLAVSIAALFVAGMLSSPRPRAGEAGESAEANAAEHEHGKASSPSEADPSKEEAPHAAPKPGAAGHAAASAEPGHSADKHDNPKPEDVPAGELEPRR